MLVLSRKPMQTIQIGDGVVVTVLEIQWDKVRIGIEAPKEICVLRSELQKVVPDLPTAGFGLAVSTPVYS